MYNDLVIEQLNRDIKESFPNIYPVEKDYNIVNSGVGRLVMLDRYSQKDLELKSLNVGDVVLTVIKEDPKYPARGIGRVVEVNKNDEEVTILIEKEFRGTLEDPIEAKTGVVIRGFKEIDKPLELYFEQIAKRVGYALAEVEETSELTNKYAQEFFDEVSQMNIIPAGRVLYGSGSGTEVTYFNCFVMPFIQDSRGGIAKHREEVMEIMSRGGGVGTNGSTLRPKHAQAKGVGGKSSGAVSWLNDIANLTHLVEQGGSRRGAQMIMMSDWHPDIIEFVISKMQNPRVLKWLSENSNDEVVRAEADKKLKFVPLAPIERETYQALVDAPGTNEKLRKHAQEKLDNGGVLEVNDEEFLSGANISVNITKEFMEAVENDDTFELRYPDLDNYTKEEKEYYDKHWHEIGDVREWEEMGYAVKVHRTVKARDIWDLISFCATYSAEPGIFFIDNANDMTNAKAYGQKVVATNPCWTGDTLVSTVDGAIPFKELANSGKDIDVYSLDVESKRTVVKTMRNPRLTKKNADIYELKVDKEAVGTLRKDYDNRYSTFRATADHNVYVYNKGKIEKRMLKDLRKGDRLVAHQIKEKNFHKKEQPDLYVKDRNKFRPNYTLLAEKKYGRNIEENEVVHHKDHNHFNNELENLELMSDCEHKSYHFQLMGFNQSKPLEKNGRWIDVDLELLVDRGMELLAENDGKMTREIWVNDCNYTGYPKREGIERRFGSFTKFRELCKTRIESGPNHVVESITYVGTEDVYNGTVDDTHNYFICDKTARPGNHITGILSANCGEQPLAPYSVCNLAAVNLANFANKETGEVLYDKLAKTVKTQVRLQDNVIDTTPYFLEANKEQALGERRVGLGVMGLHDLLIWAKVRYGSPESIVIINKVFKTIAESAYNASIDIAIEKGSFPFLETNESMTKTGFIQHLSQETRDRIAEHGIRNSHLLTIAPTGSTGTMTGVSTGLEPYFSFSYFRSGRLGKFIEVNADIVDEWLSYNPDFTSDNLPDFFASAMDLKPEEHADVQTAIQYWIDSSISKTVNAPKGFSVEEVQGIYERLYRNGAKGGTVYVDGSRDSQVLSLTKEDNGDSWDSLDLDKKKTEKTDKPQKEEKVEREVDKEAEEDSKQLSHVRSDKLDREIGVEVGNLCPICLEGQVENLGGCNTCTNCNAQLKCDV